MQFSGTSSRPVFDGREREPQQSSFSDAVEEIPAPINKNRIE
uniref:Uncharacterized protein n=1 Tax=Lotus japonicus TaxID=34305 RepID=I3SUE2_LOTJA|nr:unknown [Lotus japonicus]